MLFNLSLSSLNQRVQQQWHSLLHTAQLVLHPRVLWQQWRQWYARPQTEHLLHVLAILALVFALVLSLLRFAVPALLDANRDRLLGWVSERSGFVISTKTLDTSWELDGPVFDIEELTVRDAANNTTILRLGRVRVRLGLLDLLLKRNLLPTEVAIEGLRLAVIQDEQGTRVFGVNPDSQTEQNLFDIGGLLLQPKQLSLTNTRILFTDQTASGRSTLFDPAEVLILNHNNRHRLSARLGIDGGARGDMTLTADINTKGHTLAGWSGEVYLLTSKLDLAWLAGNNIPGHLAVEQGASSFEIWANWEANQLQSIVGRLSANDIRLATAVPPTEDEPAALMPVLALDWLSGYFRWQQERLGWRLDLTNTLIRQQGQQWPTRSLSLALRRPKAEQPATLFLGVDLLQADYLTGLLALQANEQPAIGKLLESNPRGKIKDVQLALRMQRPVRWHLEADFDAFAIAPNHNWPGVDNLRGSIHAGDTGGVIDLVSLQSHVDFPRFFRQAFNVEELHGRIHWSPDADGWRIASNALVARNHDIDSLTAFRVHLVKEAKPHIQLVTRVSEAQAKALPTYLPARMMREPLVAFLDAAVEEGVIRDGLLVIDGPANAIRFNEPNQHLDLSFQLQDAKLHYREGWPALDHVKAHFRFFNNQMIVDVPRARVFSTQGDNLQLSIASLKPLSPLVIRGDLEGELDDVLRFLRDAPMTENTAALGQSAQATGRVRTQLDLAIKINPEQPPTQIGGAIHFRNNSLSFVPNNTAAANEPLRLEQIRGTLQMTNNNYVSRGLQTQLFNTPLALEVQSDAQHIQIGSSTRLATERLKTDLPALANAPLDGESLWHVQLTIPRQPTETGLLLEARSDLVGTKVSLPLSLAKPASEARNLRLQIPLNRTRERLIDYGSTAIRLHPDGSRGSIRAPDMAGSFELPRADNAVFQAELEFLHLAYALNTQGSSGTPSASDPRKLPGLSIRSQSLRINDKAFGRLDLQANKEPDGLSFSRLSISGEQVKLSGSGAWRLRGEQQVTDIALLLEAERLGDAIAALGLKTEIDQAPGTLDAKLSWQGAPQQFSLESLNGTINIDAGKGTLLDTEPGFGRLIGLANIRALQRRLTLDFSDFAKQGFAFDSIVGATRLDNGVASTENLRIKAPAGEILIRGTTNLRTRQLDQRVTVIPQIHGALPLAGVIAGGPTLGAAMLLAGTLLGDEIDRIGQTNYRISGDFNNTQIEKLDNSGRVIEELSPTPIERRQIQ